MAEVEGNTQAQFVEGGEWVLVDGRVAFVLTAGEVRGTVSAGVEFADDGDTDSVFWDSTELVTVLN